LGVVILVSRLALAVCFGAAALGKLADLGASRRTVERFGLPARLARPAGLLLPIVELAIAGSLLPVRTARYGGFAGVVLLCAFCVAIIRVLARGEAPECNCFGSLGSAPVGRGTLVRNAALIAVAALVTIAGWNDVGPSAYAWIGSHGVLAAAGMIAAVTALQLAFSWQLFKQNGRLLERVSHLERAHDARGAGRRVLEIGEPAPHFALPDLDGRMVALDDLLAPGRGALLVFTDPACEHCDPLLPAIGRAQAAAEAAVVAVISTGADHENRAKAEAHGIAQVLLQDGLDVAESYRVYGFPGAVLLDAAGRVAAGQASGASAVADLLRTVAPPDGWLPTEDTATEGYAQVALR
jgi:methylamine dehydrogenase accessory protein MauD